MITIKPSENAIKGYLFHLILYQKNFNQIHISKLFYYIFFILSNSIFKKISILYQYLNIILISAIIIDIPYILYVYTHYQNLNLYFYGICLVGIQLIIYGILYFIIQLLLIKQISQINAIFI